MCWGTNKKGELGDGKSKDSFDPVPVSGLHTGVKSIVSGDHHVCALTNGGAVKCWGDNGVGQLGDGTTMLRRTPVEVAGRGFGVSAIAAGCNHTCAIVSGDVYCWGENRAFQLGDTTNKSRTKSTKVVGLDRGIISVEAGGEHTCALTASGAPRCWGSNAYGRLGDGTNAPAPRAVSVVGLPIQ